MVLILPAVMLTGCAPQQEAGSLPAFDSIDEAYNAVDTVLECEDNPVGDPIVPMGDGVPLTSEQRLCFENVQVDLYSDEESLQQSFDIWADSHQGEVHLVRGRNWLVVDVTGVATGERTTRDLKHLAEELDGQYAVVG